MNKKDFLARCANAYDMGLAQMPIIMHLYRAYDAIHRLEGNQFEYFVDFIVAEQERTEHFSNRFQLGNDKLGYDVIQFLAILKHPCQKCAEDPRAWHTRVAFCNHKDAVQEPVQEQKKEVNPNETMPFFDPKKYLNTGNIHRDIKKGDIIFLGIEEGFPPVNRKVKRVNRKNGRVYFE